MPPLHLEAYAVLVVEHERVRRLQRVTGERYIDVVVWRPVNKPDGERGGFPDGVETSRVWMVLNWVTWWERDPDGAGTARGRKLEEFRGQYRPGKCPQEIRIGCKRYLENLELALEFCAAQIVDGCEATGKELPWEGSRVPATAKEFERVKENLVRLGGREIDVIFANAILSEVEEQREHRGNLDQRGPRGLRREPESSDWVTLTEASRQFDISLSVLSRMAKPNAPAARRIPSKRVGRCVFVKRADVKSFNRGYQAERDNKKLRKLDGT